MLSDIISRLDDPGAAEAAIIDSGGLALLADAREAAGDLGMDLSTFATLAVRRFADRAGDDDWVQLIGTIGRSDEPGFDALSAILRRAVADVHDLAV